MNTLRYVASLIVVLLLLGPAAVRPAQAQLGVAAGFNFNRLSDIELFSGQATFGNRTGWHAEVWIDLPISRALVFRPSARYMDAGALYKGFTDDDRDLNDAFAINLLEVPIHLLYRFRNPAVNPYVIGGPVLRFPFTDDDGLNDDLNTLSLAGGLGVGLEVPMGSLRLQPELLFTFGISSFVRDEFVIAGQTFVTDDHQYLNAVMLRVGLGL